MLEDQKYSKLIKPKEDAPKEEPDNICPACDSTGEIDGQLCKGCGGKGYL